MHDRIIGTRAKHLRYPYRRYLLIRRDDLPSRLPRRTRNVPPRHLWPRLAVAPGAGPTCAACGAAMKAVSTQGAITYYRARCQCIPSQRLRKVERPIDWALMHQLFILD